MLTGRPEEEVSGSSSDLLQGLLQVHEQARLAMRSVAKALWPSASPPGSMEELVEMFKGARRRIRLWKISACLEGAREAWAMVKTRYTKLDPNHMARVGPLGSNGEEIPVSLVYDQVEVAAKYKDGEERMMMARSITASRAHWVVCNSHDNLNIKMVTIQGGTEQKLD